MFLAIDIGNTETVLGLFEKETLISQWRITTAPGRTGDELSVFYRSLLEGEGHRPEAVNGVAVCSVVPGLHPAYQRMGERLFRQPIFIVDHRVLPDLPILYHEPDSVGPDRLVNAIAVIESYGQPAVVVDLGTATTFDVVTAKGEYAGGVIAPGVITSADALFRRGARLSPVVVEKPEHVVGRSTQGSIQSGIYYGAVGAVDAIVTEIVAERGFRSDLPIVATGGLAAIVAEGSRTITVVDEALTVNGIRLAWERRS